MFRLLTLFLLVSSVGFQPIIRGKSDLFFAKNGMRKLSIFHVYTKPLYSIYTHVIHSVCVCTART